MKKTINTLCKYTLSIAAVTLASQFALGADPKAIDIPMITNIGLTAKALLDGSGAIIIDAIILAGAAYGTAQTRSPAPLIFGIVSCCIFHLAIKALLS